MLLAALAATSLALVALAGTAAAAPVGQINTFGGYGLGTGQFANPTMLGVDPSDGSIYVGDLTEKGAEDREKYRIQKFSSSGTYEAKVEIARFQDPPTDEKLVPLFGIAVDPTLHRLYVLEGGKTGAGEVGGEADAKKILIFSTIPKEGKLVPPSEGPTSLPMPTGSELIVKPRSIAVDPATHEVEVMGETKATPKHTLFQRVTSSGTLGARFVDTANKLRPGSEFAYSMAVGPTGKTYVLTGRGDKPGLAHTKAWELPEALTEISEVPGFAAAQTAEEWPYGLEENPASTFTGGPEIAISPNGSTLYWKERVEAANPAESKGGNYLVRGFNLKEHATAQVYGGSTGTSCHIYTQSSFLGVSGEGANEHVVVLDPGPLNEEVQTSPAYGGKVLVFGRGGTGCPAPTGKFKANGVEEGAEVEKGKTVTFDASGSELASGPASTAGFRKEVIWNFGDGTEQVVSGTEGGEAPATVTHTYTTAGTYTATMQIHLKNPTYGNPLVVEHKVVVSAGSTKKTYPLIVTGHGSGSGTVTSSPAGINCGSACETEFEEGTTVTLKGAAAAGSQAVAWSGCNSVNGSNECVVTMSAAKTVTATFNLEQHLLKVTKAGTGSGSVVSTPSGINCGTECEASFAHGTAVTLKGTAAEGSKAVVWSGCDSVNGSNECLVSMTAAKNVTATFAAQGKNALAVTKAGGGSGSVVSTPAGINCGSTCSAEYLEGTAVTLKGTAAEGSKPVSWSGCDKVNGSNECEVTMSAAKSVTATFALEQHILKVTKAGTGGGNVTSSPAGINCGTECEASFAHGTAVTLKGTAAEGSKPVAWSGCDKVNGSNECEVTMSAAKSVTATFALEQHILKVTKAGTGGGNVTSTPAGINCGTECEASFAHGTAVTLKGTAGEGSKAVAWSGCDSVNGSNECEVTMSAAKSVTATFTLEQHLLKVTKGGTGSGNVTSSPAGINCGTECEASFAHGTSVTLKGTAGEGSKAVAWSGCDSVNGSNECLVTMSAAKTVTATFNLEQHLLKVSKGGTGSGNVSSTPAGINCGTECEASFAHGTTVTLKGTAAEGSKAVSWSGCDSVNGSNECEVTMSAAKSVTATFALEQHLLKVTKAGSGSGNVTSTPAGINCGTECEASFAHGTSVTLKGTPGSGSKPVNWSGCDSVNGSNECLVTMSAAKTVTASFAAIPQFTLKVSKGGSGSGAVTSSPAGIECGSKCEAEFEEGTLVKLTGTPAAGSQAATWTGCDKVNGSNECEVTLAAAKTVTATFALEQHLLKVTKAGSGGGTVTSSPAGINCGPECEATFAHGTTVTLKGTPAEGSKAVAWTGCDKVVGSNECEVTMTAAKSVTATFAAQGRNALTVTKAGGGSGTVTSTPAGINCGGTCSAEYLEGTAVTLKGASGSGSQPVSWSGCDKVNGSNECEVTMSAAKAVTATFALEQHTLKVSKGGTGSGNVTSSPAGINCGTECEASFAHGTAVKLTGSPAAGSKAVSWSGCDGVNGSNECEVTMTSAKEVTATFVAIPQFTLKVEKSGTGFGTVTSSPSGLNCGSTCEAAFREGTLVKLTGTPASGSKAVVWSGCDSINGSGECEVTVNAAKTVGAAFEAEVTTPVDCSGANITGSGSTLQGPAQTKIWIPGYKGLCPSLTVGYEATSSGAGLSAWGFNGGSFDNSKAFIGSDDGPNAAQINNAKAASGSNVLVVPVAQTAIGVVVNPPSGCEVEELTNKQLESIMRGNIKIWNKVQTASGAGCVNAPITRVVRAEGSGTTYQFKNYLSLINSAALACTEGGKTWKQLEEIGAGEKPNTVWPESGKGGCTASQLSPLVTAAGGAGVVKKINVTEGAIGYAALPDIEANKGNGENPHGDTNWVKLQNNGVSNKLSIARFAAPSIESMEAANCASTQYPVPTTARLGQANPANSDWSGVFGANINVAGAGGSAEAYPLCALTYDIALTNYSKAGFTAGQEKTVRSYLAEYVTAEAGQNALESGKQFYAPLPTSANAKFDVLGAAGLAASKVGF